MSNTFHLMLTNDMNAFPFGCRVDNLPKVIWETFYKQILRKVRSSKYNQACHDLLWMQLHTDVLTST